MNKEEETLKAIKILPKPNQISKDLTPILITILILIYRFRFLNRFQIQKLLNHKYHHRILIWLNYLTKEKYLKRYYYQKLAGTPSVYSLGTKARKYFKEHPEIKNVQISLLDRVWAEYKNSSLYKRHCLFLGDIYLSLVDLTTRAKSMLNFYTKVDLHFMKYMIFPRPDAYFSIAEQNSVTKRYFLDIFDYFNAKDFIERIDKYVYYFEKGFWQNNTNKPFPAILMISPTSSAKDYIEKKIKEILKVKNLYIPFYLTTYEEIKYKGINREVLHQVKL